jgi:hypothetical protein
LTLAASGVGYSSRISTIETTGVALTGSVISLANSGTALHTGLYNTSGNLRTDLAVTGTLNAANIAYTSGLAFSVTSGVKVDLNTSKVATIMTTGVALTGSALTLAASGAGYSSRLSTIETSGLATISSDLTTVMSTGVATSGAVISLAASGSSAYTGLYGTAPRTPISSGVGGTKKTFDLSVGTTFTHTLGADTTFYLANVTQGQKFVIRTQQDGTASRSVTWGFGSAGNGVIKWAEGGTVPTGTEYPAGVVDVYGFIAMDTGTFDGFIVGSNL